jgi:hypothetical protein
LIAELQIPPVRKSERHRGSMAIPRSEEDEEGILAVSIPQNTTSPLRKDNSCLLINTFRHRTYHRPRKTPYRIYSSYPTATRQSDRLCCDSQTFSMIHAHSSSLVSISRCTPFMRSTGRTPKPRKFACVARTLGPSG